MFNISPDCGNPSSVPSNSASRNLKSSSGPKVSSSGSASTSNSASRKLPQTCIPGCTCNPLQVYINICPISKCSIRDKYPSSYSGRYDYNRTLITRETHTGKGYFVYRVFIGIYIVKLLLFNSCVYTYHTCIIYICISMINMTKYPH